MKIELNVDIKVIKEVLEERGLEPNMANMKKLASYYKSRSYNVTGKEFFKDFPKDKEILFMYEFQPKKSNKQ